MKVLTKKIGEYSIRCVEQSGKEFYCVNDIQGSIDNKKMLLRGSIPENESFEYKPEGSNNYFLFVSKNFIFPYLKKRAIEPKTKTSKKLETELKITRETEQKEMMKRSLEENQMPFNKVRYFAIENSIPSADVQSIKQAIDNAIFADPLLRNAVRVENELQGETSLLKNIDTEIKLFTGTPLTFNNDIGRQNFTNKPYMTELPFDSLRGNEFSIIDYDTQYLTVLTDGYTNLVKNLVINGDIAAGGSFVGLFENTEATVVETATTSLTIADFVNAIRKVKENKGDFIVINDATLTTLLTGTDTLSQYVKESYLKDRTFEDVFIYSSNYAPNTGSNIAVGGNMGMYAIDVSSFYANINDKRDSTFDYLKVVYYLAGAYMNADTFVMLKLKA